MYNGIGLSFVHTKRREHGQTSLRFTLLTTEVSTVKRKDLTPVAVKNHHRSRVDHLRD